MSERPNLERKKTFRGLRAFGLFLIGTAAFGFPSSVLSGPPMIGGTGELERLLDAHPPLKLALPVAALDEVAQTVQLAGQAESTVFRIPGFKTFGCDACHDPADLTGKAARRMETVLARLGASQPGAPGRRRGKPGLPAVPLRQYLIQSWAGPLLSADQFAHATFDTIRVSPRTIIVDNRVYGLNTHLHETLHLAQAFLGHPNELEAYALNARLDARFLLLNYPYFANVVTAFFMPDFPQVMDRFFSHPVAEGSAVPPQVQWFMNPFEPEALQRLERAVREMEPLFAEVSRLNREHPLKAAYLSERTGIPSYLLDLAAAKQLPPPPVQSGEALRQQAFEIFGSQMDRDDNTRLGYRIDRKNESLLHLQYQLKMSDPGERLRLYFHYLKQRVLSPEGEIKLEAGDGADFSAFVQQKLAGGERMLGFEEMTGIERKGAEKLLAGIRGRNP